MSSFFFFFFKQKTAYEMRISDWSSDVCSSDLHGTAHRRRLARAAQRPVGQVARGRYLYAAHDADIQVAAAHHGERIGMMEKRAALQQRDRQIGRASCRERVCQYV